METPQMIARPQNRLGPHSLPLPEKENLPCPRCDSTNTKFCYYNNYNLSQPRHFCKSCRRYWTHGGTLRNIPVGGGTRKNSKRSRNTCSSASASSSSSASDPIPGTPILIPPVLKPEMAVSSPMTNRLNLNEDTSGSFTTLLNQNGQGFLALGGFGLGLGPEFNEMGFGFGGGRGLWSYPENGGGEAGGGSAPCVGGDTASVSSSGCNTWQIGSGGEGGLTDGDCFGWPDLAISMAGKGLK